MTQNDPEFLALRNKWYAKLRDEGFEDLEHFDDDQLEPAPLLSNRGNVKHINYETQDYYNIASEYVYARNWTKREKQDQAVWELHAQGFSVREIMKALKRRSFSGMQSTIARLRADMLKWHQERLSDEA